MYRQYDDDGFLCAVKKQFSLLDIKTHTFKHKLLKAQQKGAKLII